MERLTYDFCIIGNHCWQVKGADNLECRQVCEEQKEGCKTCPIARAFNRLAAIENVLGDDYDLDRIRKLIMADNMVGKVIWFIKWFTPEVRVEKLPISRKVISFSRLKNGEILIYLKDGALPLNLINDVGYYSKEEAEAALRRIQNEGVY